MYSPNDSFRILVIKPSSLGDIIHGLSVIATFKSVFKNAHVTWVVRDIFEPFVRQCTCVDATLVFQRKKSFTGLIDLLKNIYKSPFYDLVFDLQGLFRSGLMTAVAPSFLKMGRIDAREGASLFYDIKVPLPVDPLKVHALDILLEFLHFFNIDTQALAPIRFRPALSQAVCLEKIPSNSLILFPNSRRKEKEWPYFYGLTKALLTEYPHIDCVWAGDEITEVPFDLSQMPHFLDIRGQLPIDQLPDLIQKGQLIIANDSGPMHLAAAMKKPILGLFGPTPPERYGPYPLTSPIHYVIKATDNQLDQLMSDTVFDVVKRLLAQS